MTTTTDVSSVALQCPQFRPLPCPNFTFDRVKIVSSQRVTRLRQVLPVRALRRNCHFFRMYGIDGGPDWAKSIIEFVFPTSTVFWTLFLANEAKLGPYSICGLELAFDFPVANETEAVELEFDLVRHMRKMWHQQGDLWVEHEPYENPRPGCTRNPTFYWENAGCATGTKIYCRHPKNLCGAFKSDRLIVRLEWTLHRARTVLRATGIDSISDFLRFNSGDFLRRYFRLERLNLNVLGQWLISRLPERARRRNPDPMEHVIKSLDIEARADPQFSANVGLTYGVKWRSSAQVRGYFRNERAIARGLWGKLPPWERDMQRLTDYRINSFFDDVTEQMAPWLEDF